LFYVCIFETGSPVLVLARVIVGVCVTHEWLWKFVLPAGDNLITQSKFRGIGQTEFLEEQPVFHKNLSYCCYGWSLAMLRKAASEFARKRQVQSSESQLVAARMTDRQAGE
jgi:hypothetical protein